MSKTTHYTNFGVSFPPACADGAGFIKYRTGVVSRLKDGAEVPASTAGERWIAEQELRLEEWREHISA